MSGSMKVRSLARCEAVKRTHKKKIRRPLSPPSSSFSERELVSRLYVIGALIFCGVFGVCSKLYTLQVADSSQWIELAMEQRRATARVDATRGDIYDRRFRPLATSKPSISVAAHPHRVSSHEQFAKTLSPILGLSSREIQRRLKTERRFVWLAQRLPWAVAEELQDLQLAGLHVSERFVRAYPQGNVAGAVLGRVSRDGIGQAGVEAYFDSQLRAEGFVRARGRDARGYRKALLTDESGAASTTHMRPEGASVHLTIDTVIQRILERELRAGQETAKARSAFGVILDANSGDILALGQSDSVNPTAPVLPSVALLRNRVIQDTFEPGSTMKAIVAAAAIEAGVVRSPERIDCENGRYRIGGSTIHDVHPVDTVSFEEALVRSSNICLAKVAERLGEERLYEALRQFGFGVASDIGMLGESPGILRPVRRWATVDIATHSFGHGLTVNALQLARAFSAVINGGYLVEPRISMRREVGDAKRVISEKTSLHLRGMLQQVVEGAHGTGKRAAIPGVLVMGKTGTAQKVKREGRGYDSERVIASFVGGVSLFVGGQQRDLTMVVIVDEPGVTPRWGGTVAAPVFRETMRDVVAYLSPKRDETILNVSQEDAPEANSERALLSL